MSDTTKRRADASSDPPACIVAAFDFDGTLSTCDSLPRFLEDYLGWPRFIAGVMLALPWLLGYLLRFVDRQQAKERLLRATLAGRLVSEAQQAATVFAHERLPHWLRPHMLDRLAWHQAQGHRTVLVSASPALYLKPWAQRMRFDAALCTELEVRDGRYTGYLASPNCWGPEKIRRLTAWWQGEEPSLLYAYGDSRGDADMLARADVRYYRGVELSTDTGFRR